MCARSTSSRRPAGATGRTTETNGPAGTAAGAAAASAAFAPRGVTGIELNGVTSEPTHVYDPGVSVVAAYRALFAQWSDAFAIGAANAHAGAAVTPVGPLVYATATALLRTARSVM